jgi:sugar phosphate isomerase/epimerase
MPDLVSFTSEKLSTEVGFEDYDKLCAVGGEVKKLCKENNVTILMLQPFSNFEGWPKGSKRRDDAFDRARGWIRIMESVGTDMLQVSVNTFEFY